MEKKMTKTAMVDYIEKTGMVINFSRSHMMRYTKDRIIEFYHLAIQYAKRYNLEIA